MIPAIVTTRPMIAVVESRSPSATKPIGSAHIGAVEERMVPTATPAYLTPATTPSLVCPSVNLAKSQSTKSAMKTFI